MEFGLMIKSEFYSIINEFTPENPRVILEVFDCFSPCITEEKNKDLIKAVTKEEILIAVSQINSLKALVLDGL